MIELINIILQFVFISLMSVTVILFLLAAFLMFKSAFKNLMMALAFAFILFLIAVINRVINLIFYQDLFTTLKIIEFILVIGGYLMVLRALQYSLLINKGFGVVRGRKI